MNRSSIICLFFLYLLVWWLNATLHAQSFAEKDFVLYNVKDGLTSNHVTGLAQDPYGYLWIATQKGLNRYDGSSFLQFYSDSSRHSLPNEHIRELKLAVSGRVLGMRTSAGLHVAAPGNLKQKNITVPPGPLNIAYIENNVHGWEADEAGNIFLLTSTGFYHFNSREELVFRYDHYKEGDIGKLSRPFGRSDGIIAVQPGTLLLATTAGTFIYHIARKDFHAINEKDDLLFQQIDPGKKWVHFMHSDEKSFSVVKEQATELAWYDLIQKKKYLVKTTLTGLDNLFGWRSKITRINDSTFTVTGHTRGFYLMQYNRAKDEYRILPEVYLPNYLCRVIFPDRQNRLWIGTDRGLLRQKRHTGGLEKISLPLEDNPLGREIGISSTAVVNGKLFVGTFGAGIYVFDRSTLRFLKRIDFSHIGNTANSVYNLLVVNKDSIYAATYGPLIRVHTKNYISHPVYLPGFNYNGNWISWQHLSRDKTWYVSTSQNNIFYYRRTGEQKFNKADYSKEGLFNILTPMHISEDPQGNIWFGGHGASRFNITEGQFDMLLDSFPKIKNARKEISQIAFDKNGKMYFGIEENGLMVYNPATKEYEHITRNQGLPDNIIDAVYLHKNKLWLGTESGLANYDIDTKNIAVFGLSDHMPEGGVTAYSFFYDSIHNQLYAGFSNTVVRFNPDSLSKSNQSPFFFIESIRVSDSSIIHHPSEKLVLSYEHNSFVVNLASVNFEDAYQQLFAYRLLKAGDESWIQTGAQRSMIFSNLAPGNYTLQVKVYIKNNSWPEHIKEINIEIRPPFWRSTWFIGLCTLLAISGSAVLFRERGRSIRRKEKVNTEIAELEMQGLHAQMNPHFVFNSLNSIKEMILTDQKKNASRYLSKFAQLIRSNLEQSRQTFVTLKQSSYHLKQYLDMERIRFRDFSYSIEIDKDLDTDMVQIPPMLLQPLAENALWHGLRTKTGEKRLRIRFLNSGEHLVCEIEDNGIGYLQALVNKPASRYTHRSMGIGNIRERMEVLNKKYGISCSLSIKDKSELTGSSESGTIVTLTFKF